MLSGEDRGYKYYTKQDAKDSICKHVCPKIYLNDMCFKKHFCIINNCGVLKLQSLGEIYAHKLAVIDEITERFEDDGK